ncbi:MAG: hypothetical protein LN588_04780 [Rickettsia endosymbiont of Bryobia graminum]|nr:hypothetical protein [Rickettsia endosymbiont of Bryobia graminum]
MVTDLLNPESLLVKEFNQTMEEHPTWYNRSIPSKPTPSMLQKIFTIVRGETTKEANTLQNTTSEVPVLSRKSKCLEHDQQEETKKEEIGRAPEIEQSKEKTLEIKKAEEQLMECTKWFEGSVRFFDAVALSV